MGLYSVWRDTEQPLPIQRKAVISTLASALVWLMNSYYPIVFLSKPKLQHWEEEARPTWPQIAAIPKILKKMPGLS
jgi:hypothetical protein